MADVSRWKEVLRNKEEQRKLLKFLIVGGSNTLVMFALYALLIYVGLDYRLAITADYVLGICLGYALNRYWTFKSQGKPKLGFLKYCVSYVGAFVLNFVLLVGFVELFGLGEYVGQVAAIALATIAMYPLQRIWVFKPA